MTARVASSLGVGLAAGLGVGLLAGSTLNVGVRFGYWGVVHGTLTVIVVTGVLLAVLIGEPRVARGAGFLAGAALAVFASVVLFRAVVQGVNPNVLEGVWPWPTAGAAALMAVALARSVTAHDRLTSSAAPARLVTALFTGAAFFALASAGRLLWDVQEHDSPMYEVTFGWQPVSAALIAVLVVATGVLGRSAWRVIGSGRSGRPARDAAVNVAAAVTVGVTTLALMLTTYVQFE